MLSCAELLGAAGLLAFRARETRLCRYAHLGPNLLEMSPGVGVGRRQGQGEAGGAGALSSAQHAEGDLLHATPVGAEWTPMEAHQHPPLSGSPPTGRRTRARVELSGKDAA